MKYIMDDLQKNTAKFCAEHNLDIGVEYRFLDLISELGELAKELLKRTDYGKKPLLNKTLEIELELGDCLFSLICVANTMDVNLTEALSKIMIKYKDRLALNNTIGSYE